MGEVTTARPIMDLSTTSLMEVTIARPTMDLGIQRTTDQVMVVMVVNCCVLENIEQMVKVANTCKASAIWSLETESFIEFELWSMVLLMCCIDFLIWRCSHNERC